MPYRIALLALLFAAGCSGGGEAPKDAPAAGTDGTAAAAPVAPAPAGPETLDGVTLLQLDCKESVPKAAKNDKGIEQWCDKMGRMDGPYALLDGTGKKKVDGRYKDNEPDGNWTWFHENGQISSKGRYKSGRQMGSWTWWHENGERSEEGDFLDGKKAGIWTRWHANGQRSEEGMYQNDLKSGDWAFFKEDGALDRKEVWLFGELQTDEKKNK